MYWGKECSKNKSCQEHVMYKCMYIQARKICIHYMHNVTSMRIELYIYMHTCILMVHLNLLGIGQGFAVQDLDVVIQQTQQLLLSCGKLKGEGDKILFTKYVKLIYNY